MNQVPRTRIFVLRGTARHYPRHHGRSSDYQDYTPMPDVTREKEAGATDDQYNDPQAGLHNE